MEGGRHARGMNGQNEGAEQEQIVHEQQESVLIVFRFVSEIISHLDVPGGRPFSRCAALTTGVEVVPDVGNSSGLGRRNAVPE